MDMDVGEREYALPPKYSAKPYDDGLCDYLRDAQMQADYRKVPFGMTLDEAVRKRDWKLFICAEDIRLATQYLEETARPKPDEDDNVRFLRRAVVYLGREFLAGRFSYDPECKSMTWLGLKSMWLCVWTPYNVVAHNLALFVDKLPTAADINGAS